MSENTMTEDDNKDTEELIPVDVDPNAKESDDKVEAADDSDADDSEDERLSESETDHEQEVVNPNRIKRAKRREVRRMAKENAQREIAFLREQNENLMKRISAVEGNALNHNQLMLDQRLNEVQREAQQAEMIIAKAVEAGNGEDVAAAMRLRDEAKAQAEKLMQAKRQVESAKTRTAGPDPRVQTYAKDWLEANPWYDPKGGDEDSAITNAIDSRLVAEGYNPATIEYWEELTARVSSRLNPVSNDAPSRETSEKQESVRKKSPPIGNTREHAPPSTRKEVYVTPERKQAMIDAGVWDDPVRRTKYLKAYQAYDKSSAR